MTFAEKVELSLRKKFHKEIFSKFCKGINEYDLIQPNDKIAVCISGGKDSWLMAKLFQELKKHNKFPFELVFLVMDPGYNKANREMIENNAKKLNVPITIFETNIFDSVFNVEKSPCYLCARMRRGYLYNEAQKLGCNKIALGHHYDDVIETILMGMLYGAQIQTMMPKLHSTNFEGMELIRPMCLIKEKDIINWMHYSEFSAMSCGCAITSNDLPSRRRDVKNLIKELKKDFDDVDMNIYRSAENVNLNSCLSWKIGDKKSSFKDYYDNNNLDEDDM